MLPTRREFRLFLAFWSLVAAGTGANRVLDPRALGRPQLTAGGPQLTAACAPVFLPVVTSALWILLTPALFWLAHRGHHLAAPLPRAQQTRARPGPPRDHPQRITVVADVRSCTRDHPLRRYAPT